MTPQAMLVGARIKRIDMPSRQLLCLTLRIDKNSEYLLCGVGRRAWGIALVEERPRGEPATGFVRKLRNEIGGAQLVAIATQGKRAWCDMRTANGPRTLLVDGAGQRGNVVLMDESSQVIAALCRLAADARLARDTNTEAADAQTLRAAGHALLARLARQELEQQRIHLGRALRRAATRLRRRLSAIESDAMRVGDAGALRDEASLIVANLHRFEPGQTSLVVSDWTTEPPADRTVDIDPRLGPRAHADRLFHRARRLERGASMAAIRHTVTVAELLAVEALIERSERATSKEALEQITVEAAGRRIRLGTPGPRASGAETRVPYRTFLCANRALRVGRGADDNDTLTLRHARPSDLWMHARDHKGAHVVVPLGKGQDCPPDLLVAAALLAVHFSDARGEDRIEVQYTRRRYVRKPKGAAPGAVLIEREKVLLVRNDPEQLRALLASETPPGWPT